MEFLIEFNPFANEESIQNWLCLHKFKDFFPTEDISRPITKVRVYNENFWVEIGNNYANGIFKEFYRPDLLSYIDMVVFAQSQITLLSRKSIK